MPTEEFTETLPHWDMSNVFPGLESDAFKTAVSTFKQDLTEMETFLDQHHIGELGALPTEPAVLAQVTVGYLQKMNALLVASRTLFSYVLAFVSTDSYNTTAKRVMSELSMLSPRLQQVDVRFSAWIGRIDAADETALKSAAEYDDVVAEHAFVLQETAEQSRYQMSVVEENLAAELNVSGAVAWRNLFGVVTSQLKIPLDVQGETQQLPLPAVINIRRYDADEAVRHKAYEAELAALASVREPLTACMNGVKGTVLTLNKHRGRTDVLHEPLDQSRIDRETLNAMISAMKESFPAFRAYWYKKAQRLGKDRLAYWDLFAPVGKVNEKYTFSQAREIIENQFATFSDDLSGLAKLAFDNNWIDAEPRDGKRGGAFCMRVPAVKESRILCNFDGSLSQLITIAHELGHAYHNQCYFHQTPLNQQTPMTLAETASIFCQNIIFNAAMAQTSDPESQLVLLEDFLIDASQVIVDITSRFLFEQKVFAKRETSELSADELCDYMTECQQETYGDGLDTAYLHPYMWAWKPHYYSYSLSFYNYPYAFGHLFGLGLYAVYQQRGDAFIPQYRELLGSTGLGTSADLAARFDIDLHAPEFWKSSLQVIIDRIEQYQNL